MDNADKRTLTLTTNQFRQIGETWNKVSALFQEDNNGIKLELDTGCVIIKINDDVAVTSVEDNKIVSAARYDILSPNQKRRSEVAVQILVVLEKHYGKKVTAERLCLPVHSYDKIIRGERVPRLSTMYLWWMELDSLPPNLAEENKARLMRCYGNVIRDVIKSGE